MNRRSLPDPCTQILSLGAWLCGAAVKWVDGEDDNLHDVDLMIPPDRWQDACRIVRAVGLAVSLNRMGGLKIAGIQVPPIDFWPGTIESLLSELTVPVDQIVLVRYRPYTRIVINPEAASTEKKKAATNKIDRDPRDFQCASGS